MAILKSQITENAQRYAASGKIDEAIAEWAKILSEPPQAQDGNIYNTISDLYIRKNDKENAVNTCLKAALVYKETGFELKGVAVLKKIFKIDPDRIDIHERLADINMERGLTGSAVDGYQKTAKLYMQRGNFKAAINVYKKFSSFYPEDPEIPMAIARLHQKLDQDREAVLAYEQAEAIYESKGMAAEARQIVEEIVRISPNYIKYLAKKEASVAALDNIASAKDAALEATEPHGMRDPYVPSPISGHNADDLLNMVPETGGNLLIAPHRLSDSCPPSEGSLHLEGYSQEMGGGDVFGTPLHNAASWGPMKESVPVLQESNQVSSEESSMVSVRMKGEMRGREQKETPDVAEIIFRAHLAEVDVYLRYGLHQNAIDKLIMAKELAPAREEPYLRLRELYLKEGQNEKVAQEVLALMNLYEQQGKHDKKEALLSEIRTFSPQSDLAPRYPTVETLSTHATPFAQTPSYEWRSGQNIPVASPPPPSHHVLQAGRFEPAPVRDAALRGGMSYPVADRSRGEEEYFDLGSAMVEELGDLTRGPLTRQADEKGQSLAGGGIEDKRQQYIETCHHLGIAHKEMGNYEKAVRELEQALTGATGRQFQDVLVMLGSCYAESGYIAQAIEILEGGLRDPRCSPDIQLFLQYELASYFEQLGDKERSFSLYKEIYRANPNFRDVSGKVKEIPYRRVSPDAGSSQKHATNEPLSEGTDVSGGLRRVEPFKDKRRISYV